ncbi:MAG: AAA family ATPase [Proteobacteria bacterium]|nr:AAA family ATPase [Pseudomonadota bacterium]
MSGYIQYYGLSINPFDIPPDSNFFFPSESHKEALASLLYVVKERKGFMLVVGEDGTGKTILINHLIGCLDENVTVVCFPHGNLSFEQMLKEILIKLELPLGRIIKGTMLHQLNEYLIQNLAQGKNLVLIIDEAQDISKDVMEELRLISNLETSTSKLLQIIFVGRPETETKLNTRGLRQLKQRIGTISRITSLNTDESMEYIDRRLLRAGHLSNEVFSQDALALICKYAGGVPRKINVLCHNALFKGFERSEKPVSAATVKKIRNKKDLLAAKRTGISATGDKKKPGSISVEGNTWLKRSLYFCLAIGCIMIAIFLGKEYLKNIPKTLQQVTSLRPSAVSEVVTTKAPVIKEVVITPPVIVADSVSKTAPVASSEVSRPATTPSESADSPKLSVASARTEIRYKRIVDIGQGANLSSLILNNYNQVNTTLMDLIMVFNPEIANPDLILIDQKIRIPEITESNLITESSDGSIKAHLGTFLTRKEAEKYKNIINIKNNEINIIPRNVPPDRIWFRVMAGPFTKEEDCLQMIQALRQRELLPAFGKIPGM